MQAVVCKFGGSSVADSNQIRKITAIIKADPRRRFIIVSAPGKRNSSDKKITDLLYLCHELAEQGMEFKEPFQMIRDRFTEITQQLRVPHIEAQLQEVQQQIADGVSVDFVASRGEYLCAHLMAEHLQAEFVETADFIKIKEEGQVDDETYALLGEHLQNDRMYVIPGFYGSSLEGEIRTFSRGGSDITGAIVACAVQAQVYENWTDVSGFLMADPTIVTSPKPMRTVTYREIRELAYMGAKVFHEEAIFPAHKGNIPINIRNTNDPENPGTMIVETRDIDSNIVIGIAGRKNFSLILVEKLLMNRELGFGRRLFGILESHGISFEHAPTGIDTMSVVLQDEQLAGKEKTVLEEIERVLMPDRVEIQSGFAIIATVGEGMAYKPGIAARLFAALAEAGVNVRIIDQGSSEINIIVGVEKKDFEAALKAIYGAFC